MIGVSQQVHLLGKFVVMVTELAIINALIVLAIYLIDRARPEPILDLTKAFFYGVTAGGLLVLLFGSIAFLRGEWLGSPILMLSWENFIEELFKLVPLLIIARNFKYFDEPVDGIIYAAFVGSGFALFEDIAVYGQHTDIEVGITGVVIGRSIPGHVLFTSITGYFVGMMMLKRDRKWDAKLIIYGLSLATLSHILFNLMAALSDQNIVAVGLYSLFLSGVVYLLIMKALRAGTEQALQLRVLELGDESKGWHMLLHLTASIGYIIIWMAFISMVIPWFN